MVSSSVFGAEVVSSYVSGPTRLRSSSGHGVDWRTGVDFQHTGSFTHSPKLQVWGRDPWGTRNISFVSRPYFFPQNCMSCSLSVGTGLLNNLFRLTINTHVREVFCNLLLIEKTREKRRPTGI